MATEEIDLGERVGSRRPERGRDRPRRVHRATRPRATVAHDHARDPQDAAADPRHPLGRGRHRAAALPRGAHGVGARTAARRVPARRPRHHRRQLRGGRHRHARARDQRGQRSLLHDAPRRPRRGDADREGHAPLRRPRRAAAAPDVERDRPAAVELRADDHGAAPRRRGRRSVGAARRDPRQQPARAARHAVRGHARVHPVRRVPQRVPRVPPRRRARVRQRLLRTDGQGAHAAAERAAPRAATFRSARRCAARAPKRARCRSRSPISSCASAPTSARRDRSGPRLLPGPAGAGPRMRASPAKGSRRCEPTRRCPWPEPDPRGPPRRVRPVVARVVDAAGLPPHHRAGAYRRARSPAGAGWIGRGIRSTGPTARDLPVPAAKSFRARWPST